MFLKLFLKIIFFYVFGIKDSIILGNKENKKYKEKLFLINLGDVFVD